MRPVIHTNTPAIQEFNGHKVYYIDSVPTVILSIHGDVAKGFTISSDLTTENCFIARGHGYFAHGKTLKDATRDLEAKIIENMPAEEKVSNFVKEFEIDTEYPVETFFKWHNTLTGSCEMGRKSFMKDHGIKMTDSVTPRKFVELTREAFGASIIKMVEDAYRKAKKW